MLSQAATMLEHVEQVTPIERLRMQLVHATMVYLQTAFQSFATDPEVRRKTNEVRINIYLTLCCVEVYSLQCLCMLCCAVHSQHVLCCFVHSPARQGWIVDVDKHLNQHSADAKESTILTYEEPTWQHLWQLAITPPGLNLLCVHH